MEPLVENYLELIAFVSIWREGCIELLYGFFSQLSSISLASVSSWTQFGGGDLQLCHLSWFSRLLSTF